MIKVYGASDDLIEVEGDIKEEFNPDDDLPSVLAFSDGTVLEIDFTPGVWRITLRIRGSAQYTLFQAANDGDSDVATLEGDIRWVLFAGSNWWVIQK